MQAEYSLQHVPGCPCGIRDFVCHHEMAPACMLWRPAPRWGRGSPGLGARWTSAWVSCRTTPRRAGAGSRGTRPRATWLSPRGQGTPTWHPSAVPHPWGLSRCGHSTAIMDSGLYVFGGMGPGDQAPLPPRSPMILTPTPTTPSRSLHTLLTLPPYPCVYSPTYPPSSPVYSCCGICGASI